MGAGRVWAVVLAGVCAACSTTKPAVTEAPATGGSGWARYEEPAAGTRYVDESLGFELTRPNDEWLLDETGERTPEGIAIPVVLNHRATGAQMVLQVAPAVASPTEFAERLTEGLRQQPGFIASDPQPLRMSDNAVGFDFTVGERVRGRVAVREGSPDCYLMEDTQGCVFMMLATWPVGAPDEVPESVDALFESVQPVTPVRVMAPPTRMEQPTQL
jgi:hypothetical protein